jgi:tetratricopeptide (TPR) repeat protein
MHSLYNRGICHERIHNHIQAVSDFTYIISLRPDYANAYFNRGCCYEEMGDIDKAI